MKLSNLTTVVTPVTIDPTYLTNLVKEVTVGVATNQISFDNLDGNTDEGYILDFQTAGDGSNNRVIQLNFNNDSTAANYYRSVLQGYGTTTSTISSADTEIGWIGSSVDHRCQSQVNIAINSGRISSQISAFTEDGSYRYTRQSILKYNPAVTNLTSLQVKSSAGNFPIGSKFKLYKKKLNPALVLTNRYLSNLVEEIRVAADCSSVTFSNLDSSLDGDYILEADIIASSATDTTGYLYVNSDLVDANYKSGLEYVHDNSTSPTFTNPSSPRVGPVRGNTTGRTTFRVDIRVIGNRVLMYKTCIALDNTGVVLREQGTIKYNTSVASLTSLTFVALTYSTIGIGSIFRLYKTNSGALRPGPSFSANKNGVDQTGVVSNTATKVTFGTEEWDTHNCYDAANSKFTPTIAGIYDVNASIRILTTAVNIRLIVYIYKNGVEYKTNLASTGYANNLVVPIQCKVYLNGSTDYIEVYAKQENVDDRSISGAAVTTYFQVAKVG